MVVDKSGKIVQLANFLFFESKKNRYYYNGLFFVKGKKAGLESIKYLVERYEGTHSLPFIEFYGAYSIVIENTTNNTVIVFSDNSNMHCFYVSKNGISDSFISLINFEKQYMHQSLAFSNSALCQYYTLGKTFGDITLVSNIKQSSSKSYYMINNNEIVEYAKDIGDIEDDSSIRNYEDYFSDLAHAISDDMVCMTLTGGYDSRFIFALLKDKVDLDIFISGDNYRDKDIIVASKIAKYAKKKLDIIKTTSPVLDIEYLKGLFYYYDGILPFYNAADIRIRSFQYDRKLKGYRYLITGDGGVLHKDWEWMQDLPFYNKKYVNLKKFYNQRIAYEENFHNMGDALLGYKRDQERNIIDLLKKYKKNTNTKSYDNLYYYITGNRQLNYNISSKVIACYAPLMEFELVKYSYHLARRERFFYNSMRESVTLEDKLLARIPTNYGTTESNEVFYLLRDIIYQTIEYFKKGARMISRNVYKKSIFTTNPMTWTTYYDIRRLDILSDALEYCKSINIVKNDSNINDFSNRQIGFILHVYLLSIEMSN